MRIVVDSGTYNLQNVGDTTMLQTGVARLSILFPNASIQVFTNDSERLAYYCPSAIPLSTKGRSAWLAEGYLFEWLYTSIKDGRISRFLKAFERRFRSRWPSLAKYFIEFSWRRRGIRSEDLNEYLASIANADLLIMTGMGAITDAFPRTTLRFLDSLDLAIRQGVRTAMFGQGIGPIQAPALLARAKEVLPKVDLISLREGRAGRPLLESLGVPLERVMVTGDDAIEFAYRSRAEKFGRGLGVNLRVSNYSQVQQAQIECIRPILQDFARVNQTMLVSIPISWVSGEEDWIEIQKLLTGFETIPHMEDEPDKQKLVISQIQQCRLIVTGSYHAAVFALAQGIPAVGLAKARYYLDKFYGLAGQFGAGCQVVSLEDPQMPIKLQDAIERSWKSAEETRPTLLDAAASQIELSLAAYRRVRNLLLS
jgi:polysaccharide pyruvyl transferase WcaK-like protein